MNLGQITRQVLIELDEDPDAPDYWTLEDVHDAINEGYECISEASEFHEVVLAIRLLARTNYYDLRSLPVQALVVRHVYNFDTSRWLDNRGVRELDGYHRNWDSSQGQPECYFLRGMYWMGFWLRPQYSPRLRVGTTALPPPLVLDDDVPLIDEGYHRSLVDYALYEMKIQDHEAREAMQSYDSYSGNEEAYTAHIRSRQNLDRINQLGTP